MYFLGKLRSQRLGEPKSSWNLVLVTRALHQRELFRRGSQPLPKRVRPQVPGGFELHAVGAGHWKLPLVEDDGKFQKSRPR